MVYSVNITQYKHAAEELGQLVINLESFQILQCSPFVECRAKVVLFSPCAPSIPSSALQPILVLLSLMIFSGISHKLNNTVHVRIEEHLLLARKPSSVGSCKIFVEVFCHILPCDF